MTVIIHYKLDEQDHILEAQVFATDADGMREYMVTEETLDELRPEYAAAIREHVAETGELMGEVEVG
jgi:hypothetical protein